MKAIVNTSATTMAWKEPVLLEPRYELWAGEDLLATLVLDASTTTLARVETAEGRWTFREEGFLRPSILIQEEDSDLDLALYHPGLLGRGRLRFTNGVTFHWRHESLGSARWVFKGEGGEVLISLRLNPVPGEDPGPHRVEAQVEVTPAGHFSPRVPLLAALGWYLLLRMQEVSVTDPPMGQVF